MMVLIQLDGAVVGWDVAGVGGVGLWVAVEGDIADGDSFGCRQSLEGG